MKRVYLLMMLSFGFITPHFSNNLVGKVQGIVEDYSTGMPIADALIEINDFKTQSDSLGRFNLRAIPVGKHQMLIGKSGFNLKNLPINIEADSIQFLRISLEINALQLSEIVIKSDRSMSAASSFSLNARDFQLRTLHSAQDMLKNVAGLVIAQHAGGGKAEQIFLRGFDADHGTDVAAFVDGLPVNLPSHGHGQGYLDLHFLIPEIVKSVQVQKGTYFAELGDFATAGAIQFKTADRLEKNSIQTEVSAVPSQRMPSFYRGLAAFQLPFSNKLSNKLSSYVAAESIYAPSYFDAPQDFKRFNLFSKTVFELNQNTTIRLTLSHFDSKWNASGQIPNRAVEAGTISRFGAIDNTEGGNTARQNINLSFTHLIDNQSFEVQSYVSKYLFNLYSNFTFFLEDSINGDMIRQQDNRIIAGFNTKYVKNFRKNKLILGVGTRYDAIENRLDHENRTTFFNNLSHTHIRESAMHAYLKDEISLSENWRAELGLRYNYFSFDVKKVGQQVQTQLAPKLNLTYTISKNNKLFLNVGRGFHSNDARAVVQDVNTKRLPDAWGSEIGVQTRLLPNFILMAALWSLEMENELVFVGDAGTTENNGASRRLGLDWSIRANMTDWLFFDADVNWSKGRFVDKKFGKILDNDNIIPLAPNWTATTGLTLRKNHVEGGLRYRYVGERAANEANTVQAKGYGIMDMSLFYKTNRFRGGFAIENLWNAKWNEAQFDTESRLKNEIKSVSELHFTAGTPFSLKTILTFYF
jgi:outer membrane receptor protein involved in Fe transport